jgi:hypothetical protein
MEADFPNAALVSNDHDLWFYLIQLSDMKVRAGAETEPVRGGRAPVCMCVCVCVCVCFSVCVVFNACDVSSPCGVFSSVKQIRCAPCVGSGRVSV